jgi:ribosomal protein L21E
MKMQTHRNDDHDQNVRRMMEKIGVERVAAREVLEREARKMQQLRLSTITAGENGEQPLREWEKYGVLVRELPERKVDEDLDLVRVSIGGSFTEGMNYCVFRGPIGQVKDVLRRALNALSNAP